MFFLKKKKFQQIRHDDSRNKWTTLFSRDHASFAFGHACGTWCRPSEISKMEFWLHFCTPTTVVTDMGCRIDTLRIAVLCVRTLAGRETRRSNSKHKISYTAYRKRQERPSKNGAYCFLFFFFFRYKLLFSDVSSFFFFIITGVSTSIHQNYVKGRFCSHSSSYSKIAWLSFFSCLHSFCVYKSISI